MSSILILKLGFLISRLLLVRRLNRPLLWLRITQDLMAQPKPPKVKDSFQQHF